MSTRNSLCHCCGRFFLALGILGLLAAIVLGGDTKERAAKAPAEARPAKDDAKEAAKMVDAIVNRNMPPMIVRRRGRSRGRYPTRFPLFLKDCDWKEEERVRQAVWKLYQDTSADLWEAMVQKTNDRRYCFTSYTGNSGDAYNESVRNICTLLAYHRLCRPFQKHLPSYPPHGCPIQFWSIQKDMLAWRKDRKDKPLYQMQIEVCEMALRDLAKLDTPEVSPNEKAEARKKIEKEITELRRTKEPRLGEGAAATGYIRAYPRKEAERVREAYEKGTLEAFRSGLNK